MIGTNFIKLFLNNNFGFSYFFALSLLLIFLFAWILYRLLSNFYLPITMGIRGVNVSELIWPLYPSGQRKKESKIVYIALKRNMITTITLLIITNKAREKKKWRNRKANLVIPTVNLLALYIIQDPMGKVPLFQALQRLF